MEFHQNKKYIYIHVQSALFILRSIYLRFQFAVYLLSFLQSQVYKDIQNKKLGIAV